MSKVTADVTVIGAGVLGSAVAYNLVQAGFSVVIAERAIPNREGSGATAGNIHVQAIHRNRPGQEVPADNARFLPLQVAAAGMWQTLEEELGADLEVNQHGGLMVAETEHEVAELTEKNQLEAGLGLACKLVDGDQAREILPTLGPTVAAANWCPLDGYANPLKVGPAYLRNAMHNGAQLLIDAPVLAIQAAPHRFLVSTPRDQIQSEYVVNAAGPWMGSVSQLAGIDLALSGTSIQMHVTERFPSSMNMLVQHVGEGLSIKQVAAGQMLIGGGWPSGPLTDGRGPVSSASMVGNLAAAIRIMPEVASLNLLRAWAGPLSITPDELPVVGEIATAPGLFVVGGTYAFTLAPLWGRVIAALVAGEQSPVDLDGLEPERVLNTRASSINQ